MIINDFGKTKGGEVVKSYTIKNAAGMTATIISYGATVTKLLVPDKDGELRDVQLGYDDIKDYEEGGTFFGTIIGRNANRVKDGKVVIDGVTRELTYHAAEIGGGDAELVGIESDLSLLAEVFMGQEEEDSQKVLLMPEVGRYETAVVGQFADKEQADVHQ